MDYTKKIIRQSDYWYNDGLKKAQMRDLSGAIVSLRESLKFNKGNIQARNLLGLVYYGRGEVPEALVEWILSKNLKPTDNPANRYLHKIQNSPEQLENINQAIRKYNQSLMLCEQRGEDMAILQLKRAIAVHPTFLKAYQLLALIYLHTGQYAKARPILKEARKLDTTNEITLRYIHELNLHKENRPKSEKKSGRKVKDAVEYNLGNETIIQPVHSAVKNATIRTAWLYIVFGIFIGAVVVWFLVAPASKDALSEKHNREVLEYSEKINAQEAQISALTRSLDQYRAADTTDESQTAAGTAESYEYLLTAIDQWESGGYSDSMVADAVYNVNRSALGTDGQAIYDSILDDISEGACETKFNEGLYSITIGDYSSAIDYLGKVVWMDESYADGEALLNLGIAYKNNGDNDSATAYFSKVKELFPDSEAAQQANAYLNEIAGVTDTTAVGDGDTTDTTVTE